MSSGYNGGGGGGVWRIKHLSPSAFTTCKNGPGITK